MNERCDLCGSSWIELAYKPPTTSRGLAVYVCCECDLVQSLPRIEHVSSRNLSVSSGASFGNIRYGKGFRTESAIQLLNNVLDLKEVRHCLDIGSNRGSFALRLREIATQAKILAVESDANVVADYKSVPGIELIVDRIEHVSLPDEKFDLVYCSHTLEHLRSPRQVLAQIRRAMTPDGALFVEVPNLNFIGGEDIVEEWFIDKHLYHFSKETLLDCLQITGFLVPEGLLNQDLENISLVAHKDEVNLCSNVLAGRQVAQRSLELIKNYQETLHKNQSALQLAAQHIEQRAVSKRVVVWGAGRIFDSLVQYGGLNVRVLAGVVDKYLSAFTPSVRGCPLLRSVELPNLAPEIVIIASRAYFNEIKDELLTMIPDCEVLGLDNLLGLAANSIPEK